LIETHYVERVLADIDADHGDGGVEFLGHGVLLVFGTPGQRNLLSGQEHGRTIPLAEVECAPQQSKRSPDWAVYSLTHVGPLVS
jgi:hypothetical protein